MRHLLLLLIAFAAGPVATAGARPPDPADPPCPPGAVPPVTLSADDREDGDRDLTATHTISLYGVDAEGIEIEDFALDLPPGAQTVPGEGDSFRSDAPGPVSVTAHWQHLVLVDGTAVPRASYCTASTTASFNLEPPKPLRVSLPRPRRGLMNELFWRLHAGEDADLRPVEARLRGVRRARLPGAKAPAQTFTIGLRAGDKPMIFGSGRVLRSAGWRFRFGPYFREEFPIRMSKFEKSRLLGFGFELEFVQGGTRIARTRALGRCVFEYGLRCNYRSVAGAAAAAEPVGDAVASAKKPKKKPVRCRKGQVRVKIGKRRSCQSKALPKPRPGDPRLLLARSVTADWSQLRNRRGKRLPSLPKLVRRLGRRAPDLLQRASVRGIARVDALASSAVATKARTAASAECDNLDQAPRSRDTFTQRDGGTTATATATLGPDGASLGIELSGNGLTVRVDINLGLCEPNEVQAPGCPTAFGQLDGEIRYRMKAAVQVSRRGEDIWSQSMDVQRRTKLQGWVETDAKLERLDVDDVETSTFRLGGSTRAFPPITIRSRLVRRARVDMRSGAYEPDRSDISVTFTMEGLGGPDQADAEDDVAERSRADADRNFRAIVDKAVSGYRSRETAWQEPGSCATLKFEAASNARRVRPGGSGSFDATAIARTDGAASELDATLSDQSNATFSPGRAGGQRATFQYVVAAAARGKIAVTVRATSKAGVARGTWEQPIEEAEEYHYRILNASYGEDLLGQANNPASACGLSGVSTSFTQANDMNVTGPGFDPGNHLEPAPGGELDGQIAISAPGTASGTINGCDIDEEPPFPACTQPFGGELLGAVILFVRIPANSPTATVTWPMPNLGGNFIGAADPSCQPDPFRIANDPNPLPTQEVPAEVFKATTPQTLSFHRFRSGMSAPQTTISSTVDLSITFVRVRPDGAPL